MSRHRAAPRAPGGHLRDRPVGRRPAPRPVRHRPHRRGVPGRRGRRRPDPRRHRRAGHLSGHGGGHRPASPGRAPPRSRTRCGSGSTGTTGVARDPARCGPSSPPAWPSAPGWPATSSSTGRCRSRRPRAAGGRQGIGGGGRGRRRAPRFSGFLQWTLPFGAVSAVNWLALVAERRMHEFALTREQLGQIALNGRRNAAVNPKAVYRDPMDLADYLAARMISTPLCLFDCDAPCDGSTAFVVSHRDYAPDAPHPACHVNAVGTALRGRASWDQFDDPTTMAARDAAASMWERTDLRPDRCRRGPALRRLLHPGHGVAGGPGLLRPGRERALRGGRHRHRADGRPAPQHRRRAAVGGPAPRLRAHPRGLRPAPGRGRRPPGPTGGATRSPRWPR